MHQCWSKTSPLCFGSLPRDAQERPWCQLLFELRSTIMVALEQSWGMTWQACSECSLPDTQGSPGFCRELHS